MLRSASAKVRLQHLKECLNQGPVLIVMHDYPDPDSIASSWALSTLLDHWKIPSTTTYGGFIGRAENKAMVELLGLRPIPISHISPERFAKIALVDCSPGNGNISLPPDSPISAVIDHHSRNRYKPLPCFYDVRTRASATSAILASYLVEAHIPLSAPLASALYFGMKTDARDLTKKITPEDAATRRILLAKADFNLLQGFEKSPRPVEYFHLFRKALRNAKIRDSLCFVGLGAVSMPEEVAEVADYFTPLNAVEWIATSGIFKNNLYFSIRSHTIDRADLLAETIARSLGGDGGGHGRYAAGKIPVPYRNSLMIARKFEQCLLIELRIKSGISVKKL